MAESDSLPDFQSAPAWLDRQSTVSPSDDLMKWVEDEPLYLATFYPFIPLRTAGEWVHRIDRDELAERLAGWYDLSDRIGFEGVADAVLAALPELMKGESDE